MAAIIAEITQNQSLGSHFFQQGAKLKNQVFTP